jgi:hypothetical protein
MKLIHLRHTKCNSHRERVDSRGSERRLKTTMILLRLCLDECYSWPSDSATRPILATGKRPEAWSLKPKCHERWPCLFVYDVEVTRNRRCRSVLERNQFHNKQASQQSPFCCCWLVFGHVPSSVKAPSSVGIDPTRSLVSSNR